MTKHSTNINEKLEKVLTVISSIAYRETRRNPARISRENFASWRVDGVGKLTVKVVVNYKKNWKKSRTYVLLIVG